ncbi:MAG TPA: chromate resistance protein ChrB domain-containing protein [Thermoanaerobaculia bacterium]|nr:chromate resistance protein ChrB domain-containing protein [Thermoanaerobaculia bacterium]
MSPKARIPRRKAPIRWYLLIHQLPPEPLYLRAKIRQRLGRVGAVALKNAVYVLPRRDECLEDFQWVAQEAVAGKGEAFVCEAEFLERKIDQTLVTQFRSERDGDYAALSEEIRTWKREAGGDLPARASRARKRLEEIERIDYFGALERKEAARLVTDLESDSRRRRPGRERRSGSFAGRIWVTRRGVHIDRIASAWLIRRFLDPKARFRFIDPKEPRRKNEIRFDMVGGDYTHEGDRCTFETLLGLIDSRDRALAQIGEIVHDIDLKDDKFDRSEAAGVDRLITGILLSNPTDERRIEHGRAIFDELYESFRQRNPIPTKEVPK